MKHLHLLLLIFLISVSTSYSQSRTIEGKVVSLSDGAPIPSATISVKGTKTGALTRKGGEFKLNLTNGNNVLVVSSVGYKTKEVMLGADNYVMIQLEIDAIQMQDIVVTALGREQEKRSLGFSVQEVHSDKLIKARESNVVNSLAGKVAGVTISNGASGPGSTSRIVIRGENSLTGDNQPLFVVDGIPMKNSTDARSDVGISNNMKIDYGNGAAEINPDDIESISVLKGPNATALYGSRAANGVVLITTKSGKGKQGYGVDFNSYLSFQSPLTKVKFQDKYGQGKDFQFEFLDGFDGGLYDGVDESWGPKLDGRLIKQFSSPASGTHTYEDGRTVQLRGGDIHGLARILGKGGIDLDRRGEITPTPFVSPGNPIDLFFETGITTTNNLAFYGANANGDFRLSFTNLSDEGMLPNTDLSRNTVSLNANYVINENLKVGTSLSYIKSDSKNRHNNGYGTESIMYVFTWWGMNNDMESLKNYWQRGLEGFQQYNYNYNYHDNPYFHMYENTNGLDKNHLLGNISLNYSILDNFTFQLRLGADVFDELRIIKRAFSTQRFQQGQYREDKILFQEFNTDFLFNYFDKLNGDFNYNVSFGGNMMSQKDNFEAVSANRLVIPNVYSLSNTDIPLAMSSERREKKINSIYAFGEIDYKNQIYLQLTGRNDWSSALPKETNSYFYPSVSISAILSDMIDLSSAGFSFAKARLSWAQVGNDTDPYRLENAYAFGTPWGTNLLAEESAAIANSELKPEIATSIEAGFDVRFFDNRVGLDFTYYTSKITNQILGIQIPISSGYSQRLINAGEISSNGIEIMLTANPIKLDNGFNWDMGLNWSTNRSEVVELAEGLKTYTIGTNRITLLAQEGERMGSIWGTGFKEHNGQIIYKDGLPEQDNTLRLLGNYNSDWVAGLTNTFSFGNLSLGFLFEWRQGGQFCSSQRLIAATAGNIEETLQGRDPEHGGLTWTDPADGKQYTDGIIGDGVMEDPNNKGQYIKNTVIVHASAYHNKRYKRENESEGMYDASFVKLRELTVSYDIPSEWLKDFFVKSIRVSFVGRNLLLFTDNPHFDPEVISFSGQRLIPGIEDYALPSERSFGFNLNVKL